MELAETVQELGVGGMCKPALADKGSSDEGGGEAYADDDLPTSREPTSSTGCRWPLVPVAQPVLKGRH